jgi:putative flavoprotein involved in K+ transport
MDTYDAIVIGAGQSGLAAARALRQAGASPVVLEAADRPGGSWPRYYDSLTLFSPARYSALPGLPFGGDPDRYPLRDEVTAYLRDYAARLNADIRTGSRVTAVTADGPGYTARLADGSELRARAVVATGSFGRPHRPALPGLGQFAGTLIHASEYRHPGPYAGRNVIVVGAGNSAVQIAVELAGTAAAVTLATGYRPALDYLAPLGALGPGGYPLHRGGVSTTCPGLAYVGLEWQRSLASASLRGVGRDARHIAGRLS